MFAKNDELDENIEDTEDTDLEDENSDDEDLEDEDTEDSDEDDEELSDEDKAKPITKGEFKEWQKAQKALALKAANSKNAARRVASKKGNLSAKEPKLNDRLSTIEQNQAKLDLIERKRQFAYENNLSPKETDMVFKMTKRPTAKFLQDPFISAGLKALRSSQNIRDNTPGAGGRPVFKVEGKDFKDLKSDEKQANFAERRRSILESQKNR